MEKWSTFTTETNKDTTLNNHRYTHGEELANTLSHGAGILLGIIAGYFLLIKAAAGNDPHWAVACVSVYLAGMLSSYISSTWYHASAPGTTKELLRKFDHGAIYLHIAGTYTPFTLLVMRNKTANGLSFRNRGILRLLVAHRWRSILYHRSHILFIAQTLHAFSIPSLLPGWQYRSYYCNLVDLIKLRTCLSFPLKSFPKRKTFCIKKKEKFPEI